MRILKEYSALGKLGALTDGNSVRLILHKDPRAAEVEIARGIGYLEKAYEDTAVSEQTLSALRAAVSDVYVTLASHTPAVAGEEQVLLSCTFHRYYYMMVFEFSESSLPLKTLNRSERLLSFDHQTAVTDVGFMNIVNLVSRVDLSVDKISEKMRLTVIKEKSYRAERQELARTLERFRQGTPLPTCGAPAEVLGFNVYNDTNTLIDPGAEKFPETVLSDDDFALAADFSCRIYARFGDVEPGGGADKFITVPTLFADNLRSGELSALLIKDVRGNCSGGAVWQKTGSAVTLMIFYVFCPPGSDDYHESKKKLLEVCTQHIVNSDAAFVLSKIVHSQIISEFFESGDGVYNYRVIQRGDDVPVSYIKPDLKPLIKKAYKQFGLSGGGNGGRRERPGASVGTAGERALLRPHLPHRPRERRGTAVPAVDGRRPQSQHISPRSGTAQVRHGAYLFHPQARRHGGSGNLRSHTLLRVRGNVSVAVQRARRRQCRGVQVLRDFCV